MEAATIRALWLAKSSSAEVEWEDGFAYDEFLGLAAIADGASSAANAASWARQLTASFVDRPYHVASSAAFGSWLEHCQAQWAPPETTNDSWWGEAVSNQASWSTFAALAVEEAAIGFEAAVASVGDTCWFHVRGGELVGAVPELTAADFGTHPELVGTGQESTARTVGAYQTGNFDCVAGDVVLGATDAVAEWALRIAAECPQVWATLCKIDNARFAELVDAERAAGRMVDDDATLLRCRVGVER